MHNIIIHKIIIPDRNVFFPDDGKTDPLIELAGFIIPVDIQPERCGSLRQNIFRDKIQHGFANSLTLVAG